MTTLCPTPAPQPHARAPQAGHRFDIYGLGNALLDKEFLIEDAFLQQQGIGKGLMTLIDEDRLQGLLAALQARYGLKGRASGGSAANSMVTASCLGSRVFYSCRVGPDEAGAFYLADLASAGVQTNPHGAGLGLTPAPAMTGRCVVMITPDAERTMATHLGITTDLGADEIDFDALGASRLLYIEGYLASSATARQAVRQAKAFARSRGIEVAYTLSDASMVQFFRDGVDEIIGSDGVDLLFCNEHEALQYSGKATLQEAAQALRALARRFAITRGEHGALVFDGQNYLDVAPHPVKPLDSNGAGDTFAGAFMHAYTANLGCEVAGQLASLAAARCVAQFGPRLSAAQLAAVGQQVLRRP